MRAALLACLLGLSLPLLATAQVHPDSLAAEPDAEAALEDLDPEAGASAALAETLARLALDPLDVNRATAEELAQVPGLTLAHAQALVRHRAERGQFADLDALDAIAGIPDARLRAARPYLTVRPPRAARFRPVRAEWLQRMTRRLDLGRGYRPDSSSTGYLGSPERLYGRLRIDAGPHLHLNLTMEKDPGEPLRWHPASATYGFDHVTLTAAVRDVGPVHALVVGDFAVRFGQGLVLWQGAAFGKGREPVGALVRAGSGVRPYGSTDENRFFRGLAATVRLPAALTATAFVSRRQRDATLHADEQLGITVRTLGASGLHRTLGELATKDGVEERAAGGHLGLRRGRLTLGATVVATRYDRPFQPREAAYTRFAFRGKQSVVAGLHGHALLGPVTLFGEVARTSTAALAGVGGLAWSSEERIEVVLLGRHYPPAFTSLHGHGFGDRNGAAQNERGVYVGLALRPHAHWRVLAYADHYRFPWLRFGVGRPTTGHDLRLVVEHRPRRWLTSYVQLRTETSEGGALQPATPDEALLRTVLPQTRSSLRLHLDYRHSPALRLRSRLEGVRVTEPGRPATHGTLLYQDVRWHPTPWLRLDARLTVFDAEAFAARVFAYESDLLYTFAVPAFSGQGQRTYILATVAPTERLSLQTKLSQTRYESVSQFGSGLDETPGNRLREFRVQIRWRF